MDGLTWICQGDALDLKGFSSDVESGVKDFTIICDTEAPDKSRGTPHWKWRYQHERKSLVQEQT